VVRPSGKDKRAFEFAAEHKIEERKATWAGAAKDAACEKR